MHPATLALLAVTGSLPAWHHHPARITGLIRDLDSYRFAVREQAARELIALGRPVLAPLKAELAVSPSAEFTRRAERVLREVRYRSTVGGPAVGGFRATLRLGEEDYPEGGDIALELEIARVRGDALPIQPPVWWLLAAQPDGGDGLDGLSRPVDGEIVLRPLSGQPAVEKAFLMAAERKDASPSELARDQAIVERIHLGQHARLLRPGAYEVQLSFRLTPFRPAGREPLVSNAIRFNVVGGKR